MIDEFQVKIYSFSIYFFQCTYNEYIVSTSTRLGNGPKMTMGPFKDVLGPDIYLFLIKGLPRLDLIEQGSEFTEKRDTGKVKSRTITQTTT